MDIEVIPHHDEEAPRDEILHEMDRSARTIQFRLHRIPDLLPMPFLPEKIHDLLLPIPHDENHLVHLVRQGVELVFEKRLS